MASIDKKSLEHLAELARLELDPEEKEKLLDDFKKILAYFEELRSLDTSGVEPTRPPSTPARLASPARFESRSESGGQREAGRSSIAKSGEVDGLRSAEGFGEASGTNLKNIFREDEERENTNKDEGTDAFPETQEGFLKIPPVFEE